MPKLHVSLGPIQETLLLTLYARALDSRTPDPILGDSLSAAIADRIDYDFTKLKLKPSLITSTALRAKMLDDIVRRFTAAHPDAVVLDLGCGLDTRADRCAPPTGIDWYDIDFPEVIELRRQLLPERTRLVGADLAEPGWLDAVPGDRPALLVAEGLFPFMPGDSFQALCRESTSHFPAGELALNGYTRFAAWSMRFHPSIKALNIQAARGFDDPREPERWGAGLSLAEEQMLTRVPEVAAFPQPLRGLARLMAHSTKVSRQGARTLRYRF